MNSLVAGRTTRLETIGADLARGAGAGAVGTLLMSAFMLAAKAAGVRGELPPKKITRAAMDAVGMDQDDTRKVEALTVVTHFGFGMAAGAGYAALDRQLGLSGRPVVKGITYGLLVWFGSYNGWVPALGIMPPIPKDHPSRARMMFAAHLVFGAVLGMLTDRTRED